MAGRLWRGLALAAFTAAAFAVPAAGAGEETAAEDALQAAHKEFSVSCFNDCWALMDKQGRTDEDVENMLLLAHTSLWHWKQRTDVTPVNLSVGYWLLSRVYALAGHADMALLYGARSLSVSEENALPPFYVGYAYEALARATALRGDTEGARGLVAAARAKHAQITDTEESILLATDLRELEKALEGK